MSLAEPANEAWSSPGCKLDWSQQGTSRSTVPCSGQPEMPQCVRVLTISSADLPCITAENCVVGDPSKRLSKSADHAAQVWKKMDVHCRWDTKSMPRRQRSQTR